MTRDDIIRMGIEAGLYSGTPRTPGTESMIVRRLEQFAALIAAAEREACAVVADAEAEESVDCCYSLAVRVAKAIRARGETK